MPSTVHVPFRADNSPNAVEKVTVFLRDAWDMDWTEEPFLFCNSMSFASSPDVSRAEFEWRYGEAIRQGEVQFADVVFRPLNRYWVKVEVEQFTEEGTPREDPLRWIGIIEENGDNVLGSLNGLPHGIQKILAYGPESLLQRIPVDWMACLSAGALVGVHQVEPFNRDCKQSKQPADRVNRREYKDRVGNRSAEPGPDGVFVFADYDEFTAGTTERWQAADIVGYLLKYFCPADAAGNPRVPFTIARDFYFPEGGLQEIKAEKRTVKEILDEVLDRRRLLGYCIEPSEEDPERFALRPFSFLDEEIDDSENDLWLAVNADQIGLIVDDSPCVEQLHVRHSDAPHYDQVVATGAPMVACGTFSRTQTLDRAWTDAEQDAYATAATDTEGYADLEVSDKQCLNDLARAAEKFSRVYTAFCLPRNRAWDTCGDAFPGGEAAELFSTAFFAACGRKFPGIMTEKLYYPMLRILDVLPLRSDHDYRGDKIDTDGVTQAVPDGVEWRYLEPLVILNVRDPEGNEDFFTNVADTGAAAEVERTGKPGLEFGCSVHIPKDGNYFQLRVDGENHHFLAKGHYVPPSSLGYEEMEPLYDWEHDLLATLAVEFPPLRIAWPRELIIPEASGGTADFIRTLSIDASDWAALHYVAPKTVVAVENGKLVRTNGGGMVRDDRGLLRRIARLAYEWYGKERNAITLTYRGGTAILRVGDLITQLGEGATAEPIRTVVTSVQIDFAQTANDTHKTTIHTQWAELDVLRMIT